MLTGNSKRGKKYKVVCVSVMYVFMCVWGEITNNEFFLCVTKCCGNSRGCWVTANWSRESESRTARRWSVQWVYKTRDRVNRVIGWSRGNNVVKSLNGNFIDIPMTIEHYYYFILSFLFTLFTTIIFRVQKLHFFEKNKLFFSLRK